MLTVMQDNTTHSDTTFSLEQVVFRVPGRTLLHPLSLTFPAGKVTGLIGHNGSGKSTLLKMLGRHQPPSAGEVLLDGQPVYENPAVKRRMTVIGDDWYYFPQANIREMARFFAGLYPAFSWERYEKLKQVFPLDEKLMLRRMSKGMQKQAAFWIAMCCMPDYLILITTLGGMEIYGINGFVIGPLIAALFLACWNLFSGRDHAGNVEGLDEEFIEEGKNPPDL